MALQRLQQTLRHLTHNTLDTLPSTKPSLLYGPSEPKLLEITLSQLLEQQAHDGPSREAVVFLEYNYRSTYSQLYQRTKEVAKGLVSTGISQGDHIGILAGNCPQYVELLFAASHIGASLVVLNCTYTPAELRFALKHSACKLLFTNSSIGKVSNTSVLSMLSSKVPGSDFGDLQQVILIRPADSWHFTNYEDMVHRGKAVTDTDLKIRTQAVKLHDVCNLQFTSGTTGSPKAAMLTHSNIINNGRFIGDRMSLTPEDKVCCPPPLFHCFGLVLGLLAALTHGSCIVFPCETFNPKLTLQAVLDERCTALHGVPAMFAAILELVDEGTDFSALRTGIAAGSPVPRKMMVELREKLNMKEITNTYGMTETSPASFMTFTNDPIEKRLSTVGKILPHTAAKIIDIDGNIVPLGTRGELCVAGFGLQKGYWRNPEKTAEVMRKDKDGTLWMYTGDEAVFDDEGYCRITGRIKDIIIRGGENIFPLEIEERLVQHPSVIQACVVGLHDEKYGEIVAAFLQHRTTQTRPTTAKIREFVHETLGWHKAPVHVFWLGADETFPQTGSGKIKKHVLKEQGEERMKREKQSK